MKMDLTAGADNQLLVSHYNNIGCSSMQVETSHPSFGPMMALMTAEQLDLDKKTQQHQGASAASHFMHEYYNDPYQVTVFQGDNSNLSHLSYEQLVIASCVEAQAVDMSNCAQVEQLKNHGQGDHEDEEAEQEELEGERRMHIVQRPAAAGTMISRKCEKSKTVCHGNAAVLSSQISSLNSIVEGRDLAAGILDIKRSSSKEEEEDEELVITESTIMNCARAADEERIREKIVTHPDYRRLVMAYINCRKVGAPPDVVTRLDELSKEYDMSPQLLSMVSKTAAPDAELDHFMQKTYCHALHQYEEELSKPLNEAMAFLQRVELQISQLVTRSSGQDHHGMSVVQLVQQQQQEQEQETQLGGGGDENYGQAVGSEGEDEEEGGSCGEVLDYESCMAQEAAAACCNNNNVNMDQQAEDKQLKEQLLHKYRGCISNLKNEFMKKKKKGKLPKDARQRLLDWWHEHYKWPYPSETEKVTLAETTGLDQKQINNWFINQRKRHWKPSDQDMRYVMVNGQDPPMHDPSPA